MRYLIKSATVTIRMPWRFANRANCGTRAIVPSSFITSQITPAGYRPAIRARSTEASVWPARTMTPPLRARSGDTWPGRTRSAGLVAGLTAASTVAARSAADIPVVTLCFASIGTQNAVPNSVVFALTASGISSSSRRSPVSDRQIWPRPYRAMKLIVSGVTFSAAIVRSPSFSRSASSTTITMRPARMSSTACSIDANGVFRDDAIVSAGWLLTRRRFVAGWALAFISVCDFPRPDRAQGEAGDLRRADNILPHHVAFQVDAIAKLRALQIGVLHGERHELYVEPIDAEAGHGQADAVDGDRTLVDEIRRQLRRKSDGEPVELRVLAQFLDVAHRIDMALYEVATETAVGAQRPLQVQRAAVRERAERRHPVGLGTDIGMHLLLLGQDHRKADPVHREAVARRQFVRERGADAQPEPAVGRFPFDQLADSFNQSGEHTPLPRHRARAGPRGARRDPPTRTVDRRAAARLQVQAREA